MEAGIGKQNRSREEREKGENKRKIGIKGLSPDRHPDDEDIVDGELRY